MYISISKTRMMKIIGLGLISVMAALLLFNVPALAKPQPPTAGLPQIVAAAPAADSITINLCADEGTVTMPDSTVIDIWGFSLNTGSGCDPAQIPGPPLIVNVGDVLTINLENNLDTEDVSIVFPGLALIPDEVGATAGGGTVSYTFTATEPGTYLYESGVNYTRQIPMGLYGALVVRPAACPTPPCQAYSGSASEYDVEQVLVLSEIDPDLNDDPLGFDLLDYAPKYWLINGEAYPDTDDISAAAGDRVLLRYVNAGLTHHTMTLLGTHQRVIARDAFELPFPFDAIAETIPAGQTTDTIATIPGSASSGTSFPLYNRQLHVTNVASFPGGMLTFIEVP